MRGNFNDYLHEVTQTVKPSVSDILDFSQFFDIVRYY